MSKSLEERYDELAARVAKLEEENTKRRTIQPFVIGDTVRVISRQGVYTSRPALLGVVNHIGAVLAVDHDDQTCYVAGAKIGAGGMPGWVDFCDLELVQS